MGNYRRFVLAATLLCALPQLANAQAISFSVARHSYRESPEVNNYLSARYDYLLTTNPRFRAYRMWKECHTINFSPELHASCLASFDQYTPRWR